MSFAPPPPPRGAHRKGFLQRRSEAPGEHRGGSHTSQFQKVSICWVRGDPSNRICFAEVMWDQKPYWLSDNHPITPCVCRKEQLGNVSNLLEIKISNICWHLRHWIHCASSKNQLVGSLNSFPILHRVPAILRRQRDSISFWENRKILVRYWAKRCYWTFQSFQPLNKAQRGNRKASVMNSMFSKYFLPLYFL